MISMKESPLFWPAHIKGNVLYVLDETLIPRKVHYIPVRNAAQAVKVIKEMKTRAFGQFLVVLNSFLLELNKGGTSEEIKSRMEKTAEMLNNSRPTFPFSEVTGIVVGWANQAIKEQKNITEVLTRNINGYLAGIRHRRLERVQKIAASIEDG